MAPAGFDLERYAVFQNDRRSRGRPPRQQLPQQPQSISTQYRINKTPSRGKEPQRSTLRDVDGRPDNSQTSLPDDAMDQTGDPGPSRRDPLAPGGVIADEEPPREMHFKDGAARPKRPKRQNLNSLVKELNKTFSTELIQKILGVVVPNVILLDLLVGNDLKSSFFKAQDRDTMQKLKHTLFQRSQVIGAPASAAVPLNRPDETMEINISAFKENSAELIRNSNMLCCAASPKAVIKLADENIIALIDTGSETNIIDEREADSRGLITTRGFRIRVTDINTGSTIIVGIVENTIINAGGVGVLESLIVVKNLSCPLILGMPFNIKI